MILLAGFILKGQLQAALVVAAMSLLGLLLPPFTWISAAAIVLVTLVKGYKQGLITSAVGFIGTALLAYVIFANIKVNASFTPSDALEMVFYFMLMIWLPAWIEASILKRTVSLAYSLQVLTLLSLAAVAVFYVLYPDFGENWRVYLNQLSTQLASQADQETLATLQLVEKGIINLLPGLFVSSIMLGTLISLFLGRWWQAVYFNPGGFAKEFQSLSLGRVSAIVALLIITLALLMKSYMLYSLMIIVIILYLIQGTAIMHAVFRIRKLHKFWIAVIYGLMMFIPQVTLIMVFIGLADSWVDIRRRLTPKSAV